MVIKDPTTPQVRCYTTLCNVNIGKLPKSETFYLTINFNFVSHS